jgi:hypothetical protein
MTTDGDVSFPDAGDKDYYKAVTSSTRGVVLNDQGSLINTAAEFIQGIQLTTTDEGPLGVEMLAVTMELLRDILREHPDDTALSRAGVSVVDMYDRIRYGFDFSVPPHSSPHRQGPHRGRGTAI